MFDRRGRWFSRLVFGAILLGIGGAATAQPTPQQPPFPFLRALNVPTGGHGPGPLRLADVDHDGNPDFIVGNQLSGAGGPSGTRVLFGGGSGTNLVREMSNPIGDRPLDIAVADLNDDGKQDLVILDTYAGGGLGPDPGASGPQTVSGVLAYVIKGACAPDLIAVGDIDDDGNPDLLGMGARCGAGTAGSVWLQLGTGTGDFGAPALWKSLDPTRGPFQMMTASLDGDGRPDVLITAKLGAGGTSPNGFYIFYSSGAQPYVTVDQEIVTDAQTNVLPAVGNVYDPCTNQSCNPSYMGPDVVFPKTTAEGSFVSALLNDVTLINGRRETVGEGGVTNSASPASLGPLVVTGFPGVPPNVAFLTGSGTVTVMFNDGRARFRLPITGTTNADVASPGATALAAADVNRNVWPDLVVTNRDSNTLAILLDRFTPMPTLTGPAGRFLIDPLLGPTAVFRWAPPSSGIASSSQSYYIDVGTTPGGSDVYSRSQGTNLYGVVTNLPRGTTVYVRLWTRVANGWLYTDKSYTTYSGTAPRSDFDGNAVGDIVWRNYVTGENLLGLMVDGRTVDRYADLPPMPDTNWQLVAHNADFNGDLLPDLVWRHLVTGENLIWYMAETVRTGMASLPAANPAWLLVGAADMNGDSRADLIFRHPVSGANVVWFMNGTTVIGAENLPAAGSEWNLVATSDMDRDGHVDLLWRHSTLGANVVWYMNGTAIGRVVNLAAVPDLNWQLATVLEQPGSRSLIWHVVTTGANQTWEMFGETSYFPAFFPFINDTTWNIAQANILWARGQAAHDVNRDGRADITWRHATTGANLVWYMNGETRTGSAALPALADPAWELVANIDMNGDAKPDLLWHNTTSGLNVVWYMSGTTILQAANLHSTSNTDWRPRAVADLDGDGRPDLILRHAVTGDNLLWLLNGRAMLGSLWLPAVPDWSWTLEAAADFNADGYGDLVWRNVNSGVNVVWHMQGATQIGGATLPPATTDWWVLGAVRDLNADGRPDLIWRNNTFGNNVVWYLNGTTVTGAANLPPMDDVSWRIVK